MIELLAVDQQQTLSFFRLRLSDISEPPVDPLELLYNASLLAHYAQVSTVASDGMPTPTGLSDVYDHFVTNTELHSDSGMMETAGAQCLLLTGFFAAQQQQRHNLHWYAHLGMSFFARAALHEPSVPKARLLDTLSRRFEVWRLRQVQLSRELRDQPYLLAPRRGI